MAIKDFLNRCRPAPLYAVLILSICYFCFQMVLSHITHALTLLMASYHVLCNIFALTGCLITIKHSKQSQDEETPILKHSEKDADKFICMNSVTDEQSLHIIRSRERKLRNTFGWKRIDILTMLIVFIILASLSFSLLVEALQTLVHIDHQDTMHLPIPVLILGFSGLILNGICYLLIGGFTVYQSSFLRLNAADDIVLGTEVPKEETKTGVGVHQDDLKASEIEITEVETVNNKQRKPNFTDVFRDISSTLFVIVCAIIVYMSNDEHTAKFIDPVLSIFSCIVLVTLSYPYMKEACLILLQTIPDSIDMEVFEQKLVSKFPEIVSFHDLHIWQLTSNKYVATIHIKFRNQKLYLKIIEDVKGFFVEHGITIVTIQPEFPDAALPDSLECLMSCKKQECVEKVCCRQSRTELQEVNVHPANTLEEATADKTQTSCSDGQKKELSKSSDNMFSPGTETVALKIMSSLPDIRK